MSGLLLQLQLWPLEFLSRKDFHIGGIPKQVIVKENQTNQNYFQIFNNFKVLWRLKRIFRRLKNLLLLQKHT